MPDHYLTNIRSAEQNVARHLYMTKITLSFNRCNDKMQQYCCLSMTWRLTDWELLNDNKLYPVLSNLTRHYQSWQWHVMTTCSAWSLSHWQQGDLAGRFAVNMQQVFFKTKQQISPDRCEDNNIYSDTACWLDNVAISVKLRGVQKISSYYYHCNILLSVVADVMRKRFKFYLTYLLRPAVMIDLYAQKFITTISCSYHRMYLDWQSLHIVVWTKYTP